MKFKIPILYAGSFTILLTIVFFMIDQVDKRIQKAVTSPDVLSQLAKHVRLPFVIVDENEVRRYEHNTEEILENILIKLDDDNGIKSITVIPKVALDYPPIIETLNFSMAFSEPTQVRPYSWVFTPAESDSQPVLCSPSKAPDPEKKLIRQFKITLIRK